jgi:hypothetical protein
LHCIMFFNMTPSTSLYRKLRCHGPECFCFHNSRHNKPQFQGINVLDYII